MLKLVNLHTGENQLRVYNPQDKPLFYRYNESEEWQPITGMIPFTTEVFLSGKADTLGPNLANLNVNIRTDWKFNIVGELSDLLAGPMPDYAFPYLFSKSNVVDASELILPTPITKGCFEGMFWRCLFLEKAPNLPATELADSCYKYMFNECDSLEHAQGYLPATTLKPSCYEGMYEGCVTLKNSPKILATKLAPKCCERMFCCCNELSWVSVGFKDDPEHLHRNETHEWLVRVADTGKIIHPGNPWFIHWEKPSSSVPEGWTQEELVEVNVSIGDNVEINPKSNKYYRGDVVKVSGDPQDFVKWSDGSFENPRYVGLLNDTTFEYSTTTPFINKYIYIQNETDEENLIRLRPSTRLWWSYDKLTWYRPISRSRIRLKPYERIYLKGKNFVAGKPLLKKTSGPISVGGYIYSLIDDNFDVNNVPAFKEPRQFSQLFLGCTDLVRAIELRLDNGGLTPACFESMFEACVNLTAAPTLPNTDLEKCCYQAMFFGCTKLAYMQANFATSPYDYKDNDGQMIPGLNNDALRYWNSRIASRGAFVPGHYPWSDEPFYYGQQKGVSGIPWIPYKQDMRWIDNTPVSITTYREEQDIMTFEHYEHEQPHLHDDVFIISRSTDKFVRVYRKEGIVTKVTYQPSEFIADDEAYELWYREELFIKPAEDYRYPFDIIVLNRKFDGHYYFGDIIELVAKPECGYNTIEWLGIDNVNYPSFEPIPNDKGRVLGNTLKFILCENIEPQYEAYYLYENWKDSEVLLRLLSNDPAGIGHIDWCDGTERKKYAGYYPKREYHYYEDDLTEHDIKIFTTKPLTAYIPNIPIHFELNTAKSNKAWFEVLGNGKYIAKKTQDDMDAPLLENDVVKITCMPTTEFAFKQYIANDEVISTSNPYEFTMTEDVMIYPDVRRLYMVSFSGGYGKYIVNGVEYDYYRMQHLDGDTLVVEFIPREGYTFIRWGDSISENPRQISVSKNISLTAITRRNG